MRKSDGTTTWKSFRAKAALGAVTALMLGVTLSFLGSAASAIPDDGNRGQEGSVGAPSDPDHSSDDNQDERDRKAREEANKPKPPAKPSPNPPPDNQLASGGAANDPYYYGSGGTITDTIFGTIITYEGGACDGYQCGSVGLQGKPANDPVNPKSRSAVSGGTCNFHSGTTNLDDTKRMFPAECGAWSPYVHKCDYSSTGWHCYFQ